MTYQANQSEDVSLKPCAFCGREPVLLMEPEESTNDGRGTTTLWPQHWFVCCSAADGFGGCGAASGMAQSEAAAIKLWNRRALPPQAKAEPAGVSEKTAPVTLPPVPEHDEVISNGYGSGHSDAQLQDYARRAVLADRAILSAAPSTGVREA